MGRVVGRDAVRMERTPFVGRERIPDRLHVSRVWRSMTDPLIDDHPDYGITDHALAFEAFHEANPRVYDTLVRLAREWVTLTGSHRLGMQTLYERTRWEVAVQTSDPDYRLNNNHVPFYARLIMYREPDLDGMFEIRRSEADGWMMRRIQQAREESS